MKRILAWLGTLVLLASLLPLGAAGATPVREGARAKSEPIASQQIDENGKTGLTVQSPAEDCVVEGTVSDANTGSPLSASIGIDGYGTVWTDPTTGYYSVTLTVGSTYTFQVAAAVSGYQGETRVVGPLTGNRVEDFALEAGLLDFDPPSMHVTLTMGMSMTVPATLSNAGGAAVLFDISEIGRGYRPPLDIPPRDGNSEHTPDSIDRAPSAAVPAETSIDRAPSAAVPAETSIDRAPSAAVPAGTSIDRTPSASVPAETSVDRAPSASVPAGTSIDRAPSASVPAGTSVDRAPSAAVPAETSVDRAPSAAVPAGTSVDRAPSVDLPAGSPGLDPLSQILGPQVYAVELYPDPALITFLTDDPGGWTIVGPLDPASLYYGGDFVNGEYSRLFVFDAATNGLYTLDTQTAAATLIGPSIPGGGETWTGMAGAPDGTLYGSATICGAGSTLYTVDPATGQATTVGPITNAPCIIALAVNTDGELYGVDIVYDVLLSIDPNTGAGTVIGPLGFNANYAQSMDFDDDTGILYLAAYSTYGELRIVDTATGNTYLIGPLPNGMELDCLAFSFPCTCGVPWLDESSTAGLVPAGGEQPITVTFDALMPYVNQPGDYLATMNVGTNTPYDDQAVDVTMTVLPTPDMGEVEGLVSDICDDTPIEARIVFPDGVPILEFQSGPDGRYSAWLVQGTYEVVFSALDYLNYTTTVEVTAGQTTILNAKLSPIHACADVDPESFEFWVLTGTQGTMSQTLINNGGQLLSFEYEETGQTGPPLHIPPSDGNFEHTPASIGPAPRAGASAGPPGPNPLSILGLPAFAVDIWPGYVLGLFDTSTPGDWSIIAPVDPASQYFGGDFLQGNVQELYVVDYATNYLYTLDTTTGVATQIGPAVPGSGESWTGLTGAPDGTLYGSATTCGSSTLYTVDPSTGQTTAIGPITNGPCIIDIAAGMEGEIYGLDVINDVLVRIDPATGAGTVIGSIGFDANYAQGMDFAQDEGVLYLAAFNNSTFRGELRIADTSTGNSVLVGPFPNGDEVDCLAFALCCMPPIDVPWLWETPVDGTVAPLSTFDAEIGVSSWYMSGTQTIHLPLGTYTATMRLNTNATDLLMTVTMHIYEEEMVTPTASFESSSPVCLGAEIVLTDTSGGGSPIASWLWSFGDGYTSTLQNPTHLYAAAGSYDVSLTVCNAASQCDMAMAAVEVLPLPTAGFSYAAILGTVTFTNTSTEAIAYMWDFGDGITSTLTNPVHTYAASGSYTATLGAMNGCGVDSYAAVVTVNVCEVPGGVSFTYSPAAPYVGDPVFFTGTVATGTAPFSFTWDFGDSGTGSGAVVSHAFAAAGSYTVTMAVANACGTDVVLQAVDVRVWMYVVYLPIVVRH